MTGGRPRGRPRSPLGVRKIYTVTMEPRVDRALRAFGAGGLAVGIARAAELACAQAAEGVVLRVAWRRAKRARHETVAATIGSASAREAKCGVIGVGTRSLARDRWRQSLAGH